MTARLWRCPALRRPYSKTFPRAKRRIRACNRFQPPGTARPRPRAKPCANGLVDVSSLQDVRTPASSSSATGAASVGSFGSGASALLDLTTANKTSLQKQNAASTAALLCTFARLVSMLELQCISPLLYGLRREGALHDVAAKSRDVFLVVRPLGTLPNSSKRKHTDGCRTNSECQGASSDNVDKSTRRGSGTHTAEM